MSAAIANFTIEQGTTWRETLQFKDEKTQVVTDLTGHKVLLKARPEVGSNPTILVMSTENGKIQVDGPQGTIRFVLSAAETAALNWTPVSGSSKRGRAVYQVDITDAQNNVERFLKGTLTLNPEFAK